MTDNNLWVTNGDSMSLDIEFSEVDKNKRTVTGYATIDNVDSANDIVTADASLRAFTEFGKRGNIRVQHNKERPVAKLLNFEPVSVIDPETNKIYTAIKVVVRISDTAEDVLTLCDEGILSGFSIGAAVKSARVEWNEELNKKVQIIDDYRLLELSLVDSPMNKLANVTSVVKSANVEILEKGFVGKNLFWCAFDRVVVSAEGTSANCSICNESMTNLGHVEENTDIVKQLNKVFDTEMSKKGGLQTLETNKNSEQVEKSQDEVQTFENANEPVVETTVEDSAPVLEEATTEDVATDESDSDSEVENVTDEVVEDKEEETSVDVSSDTPEPINIEELFAQFSEAFIATIREENAKARDELAGISKSLESTLEAIKEKSAEVDGRVEALVSSVSEKLDSFENKLEKSVEETEQKFDKIAASTAVRKSIDSDDRNELKMEKSADESDFNGVFSGGVVRHQ